MSPPARFAPVACQRRIDYVERQTLAIATVLFASITTIVASGRFDTDWSQHIDLSRAGSSSARTVHPVSGSAKLSPTTIKIDDSTVEVEVAPGALHLPVPKLIAWVSAAGRAVTYYYGRFPVHEARILIVPVEEREGVLNGTSWGTRPAFTRIYVGQLTVDDDLKDDWIMTHEMVHYAFPSVAVEHHWIEEGIATYVEPIARLEAGQIHAARVWGDLVRGLPLGLPQAGDQGLDHTHTWGRTYWGGAMFCLLADIRIRRETNNRYGLRDALRAIVIAGGNMQITWPLTHALDVGDKAVGVPVLMQLYNEMKTTPLQPDLGRLWGKLGIEMEGEVITFDDTAPWAAVRRSIAADASGTEKSLGNCHKL
jgi:hypothetical protein